MKKSKKRDSKKEMKDVILSKFTSGREKGIQKRKKTLLMEYKLQNKANKFIDRRIGERDRAMTNEDRIMARFVAQRVKAHNKKQIFNLDNEDEIFTHQGRTLQDIEKYDNPQSESEDDEEGQLNADFVEKAHFGGGLFTKVSNDDSHKSTIDQLIAESKKRKAERQQTKEETQTLTDKLDENLKELFPVFSNSATNETEVTPNVKPAKDSYDVLVRELRFEPIGKPTSKSRIEDQQNAEKEKKIQKLENERLERMKRKHESDDEEEESPPMQELASADSLDDGFDLDVFDEEADDNDDSGSDNDDENSDEDDNDDDDKVAQTEDDMQLSSADLKSAKVPTSLKQLQKIINELDVSKKIEKIENLLRDQQVHCGTSNKKHLMNFFSVLLDYTDSIFSDSTDEENSWCLADKLSPVLFELVQMGGDTAAEIVYKRLAEKFSIFCAQKKPEVSADTLVLLKLIPLLFPTSDYYHSVATPASAFLSQILFKNSCSSLQLIAKGLFVAMLVLEYISLSHRFCPEVISFLRNVLYTAATNYENTYPPVQTSNKILVLNGKCCDSESQFKNARLPSSFIIKDVPENDKSKLILIQVTLKLLTSFCELYKNLPASYAILDPIEKLIKKLPLDSYPSSIRKIISELESKISSIAQKPLNYLMAQKKRPKALRLYEPNIRPIIENRSLRTISQKNLEREKLLRQYKKEKKGALKEIRKDRTFIAHVKMSEQAKRDAERKNKVKQIFGWGQSQQSELKRMERKNRFKRR